MSKIILVGVAVLTVTPKQGWTPQQVVESDELDVQGLLKHAKSDLEDLVVTKFITAYGDTVLGAEVKAIVNANDNVELHNILNRIGLRITSPLGRVRLDRWASWSVEDSR